MLLEDLSYNPETNLGAASIPYRKYTLCLPRLHHGGFIVFFQERFLFRNGRACMFFLESNLLYNVTHNVTLWNCV